MFTVMLEARYKYEDGDNLYIPVKSFKTQTEAFGFADSIKSDIKKAIGFCVESSENFFKDWKPTYNYEDFQKQKSQELLTNILKISEFIKFLSTCEDFQHDFILQFSAYRFDAKVSKTMD